MKIIAWILAVFYLGSGAAMVAAPAWWYVATPGVPQSGPYNPHFVIDVGISFGVSGAMLAWAAGGAGWRLALAGALFPAGHALFHVVERLGGDAHGPIVIELFGIHVPVVACLALAWAWRRLEA